MIVAVAERFCFRLNRVRFSMQALLEGKLTAKPFRGPATPSQHSLGDRRGIFGPYTLGCLAHFGICLSDCSLSVSAIQLTLERSQLGVEKV